MASTKMFSVKDAEIYTEIYVDKLSDVGNDNESENCDEKSDNTSNGSEIVAPRKEIVRRCFSKSRKTVITSDKMKKFMGIIFLMDHMVKKNLKDYRLPDSLGERSIFSKFMNGN
ncbi:uncharacterized protein V1477_003381 [Vespula maculifrons]|uniref:Uncharacterized protein n=1 Tax=Vespula maculifrons TaxID=7453 RepID=A0ABD2CUC4_VESMC